MNPISATTGITFQQTVVNSIRLNLDTEVAICLYTNNNSKRSTMIAMITHDCNIENNYMPNSEQDHALWHSLGCKNDQKFSIFGSVLN